MTVKGPDTIDVIEQVLDTPAFVAALAVGAFVGAISLYVYQTYHKNLVESIRVNTIRSMEMIAGENTVPASDEVQDYAEQVDKLGNRQY